VPPGVADENTLRLAGKGEDGGHLYVVIAVKPHARFKRVDDDLHVDVVLSNELAASGGRVKVPLLRGEREVDLPANTQGGDTLVVRGCGIQRVGAPPTPIAVASDAPFRELDTSGRGNLVVTWRLPEKKSFRRWLFGR
jgi:DnaJ-class molecular chaperone